MRQESDHPCESDLERSLGFDLNREMRTRILTEDGCACGVERTWPAISGAPCPSPPHVIAGLRHVGLAKQSGGRMGDSFSTWRFAATSVWSGSFQDRTPCRLNAAPSI